MRRGFFLTIDGQGGAGKSTATGLVHKLLTEQGHTVHATTEPTSERLGTIARYHASTYTGHALACLVAADRYHHLRTIRQQLDQDAIVVCDRYVPSSYVLQRMDGVPIEFIEAINADADIPDLAVVLTADPAVTAERIGRRGRRTRFETGVESSQREADLYADAAQYLIRQGYPLVTIDTTDNPAVAVAESIADEIAQRAHVPR